MNIVSDIYESATNEYDAYDKLVAELEVRQANGLTEFVPEIEDAIEAIEADWADQQVSEIQAEMAIERYYEGGWDKSGEYADPRYN